MECRETNKENEKVLTLFNGLINSNEKHSRGKMRCLPCRSVNAQKRKRQGDHGRRWIRSSRSLYTQGFRDPLQRCNNTARYWLGVGHVRNYTPMGNFLVIPAAFRFEFSKIKPVNNLYKS
jgi:hypothetical protein